jgi:hypothetical protein
MTFEVKMQYCGTWYSVREVVGGEDEFELFFHEHWLKTLTKFETALLLAVYNAGIDAGYHQKSGIELGNL